jgi:hypothetical protein
VSKSKAKPRSRSAQSGSCFNALAVVLVVFSILDLAVVALVFVMPNLVPVAFRAPTEPVLFTIQPPPTATVTPSAGPTSLTPELALTFPPTWTPPGTPTVTNTRPPSETPTETPTETPRPTGTLTPTVTLTPSKTQTFTPTGPTPTPSRTLSPFNYLMQNGHPTYMQNWANTAGCSWLGIAGQVFDLSGRSVQGLYVHLEGGGLNVDAPTGAKPAYGPSGYELYLTDHVVNTTDIYKVQLRDSAGKALSDWYLVPTFQDCAKNLILVNFEQNH